MVKLVANKLSMKSFNSVFSLSSLFLLVAACTPQTQSLPSSTPQSQTTAPVQPSSPSQTQTVATVKPSAKPLNVILEVKADKIDERQLTVRGKTNLPNGFIMTVGVCRYHFEKEDNQKHCLTTNEINPSNQKIPVSKGQFMATFKVATVAELKSELVRYSQAFQDPNAAKYVPDSFISISVVGTPRTQSPEIIEIIGKDGENLKGKSTVRKKFTTVNAKIQLEM